MKIHGMLLVKNEADIIEWSLQEVCRHFDFVYVMDNGSEDATWDIVQDMAQSHPQIIPFERNDAPFSDALRSRIFNKFKDRADEGDWWCRFDADEIFVGSPRELIRNVSKWDHVVWGLFLLYELVSEEVQSLERSEGDGIPKINESNCPRFYRKDYFHSEPRFFRHRKRLVWENGAWPTHVGISSPLRQLVRHYRYRSPQQIQTRLTTRQTAAATGWPNFAHEMESSWMEKIRDQKEMYYDSNDGKYQIDYSHAASHREPFARLFVKRVLHSTGLWP